MSSWTRCSPRCPARVGMNNHMGSKATADETLMTAVLGLSQAPRQILRGQPHDGGHGRRPASPMPSARQILQRNVFIDDDPTESPSRRRHSTKGSSEAKRHAAPPCAIGHVQNKGMVDILRAAEPAGLPARASDWRGSRMS